MKLTTMLSRFLIIAAAISASVANASPLTWTLQGAIFTDGASASGTLVTDSITGNLLGFNVTTSAGATCRASSSTAPAARCTGATYGAATRTVTW